jgi:hypothetical protein
MMTSLGLQEFVAATPISVTPFQGVVTGVILGAALTFGSSLVLDAQRAKRDRKARFLEVRRIAYAGFLVCCDSIRDALRSAVSAEAAIDEMVAGQDLAFGSLREAAAHAGQRGDALVEALDAGVEIDSEALRTLTGSLLEALRKDGPPAAAMSVERFEQFMDSFADLKRRPLELTQALARAREAIEELGAIIVDIQLVGGDHVLTQADNVLRAVSDGPSIAARLEAADKARANFCAAAGPAVLSPDAT